MFVTFTWTGRFPLASLSFHLQELIKLSLSQVTSRPGLNKAQLADSLSRHFHSLPVVEKEAITYFLYMIKVPLLPVLDIIGTMELSRL